MMMSFLTFNALAASASGMEHLAYLGEITGARRRVSAGLGEKCAWNQHVDHFDPSEMSDGECQFWMGREQCQHLEGKFQVNQQMHTSVPCQAGLECQLNSKGEGTCGKPWQLKNAGNDCWEAGCRTGACDNYCGNGGVCCRQTMWWGPDWSHPECDDVWFKNWVKHTCIKRHNWDDSNRIYNAQSHCQNFNCPAVDLQQIRAKNPHFQAFFQQGRRLEQLNTGDVADSLVETNQAEDRRRESRESSPWCWRGMLNSGDICWAGIWWECVTCCPHGTYRAHDSGFLWECR